MTMLSSRYKVVTKRILVPTNKIISKQKNVSWSLTSWNLLGKVSQFGGKIKNSVLIS